LHRGQEPDSGKQNHKQEVTDGMSGTTVKLNERNTARLLKVAGLLECEPETFLNEYLMSALEDPSAAVECMDFTEGGTVGRSDAERARKRVMAAALVLAREGWEAGKEDASQPEEEPLWKLWMKANAGMPVSEQKALRQQLESQFRAQSSSGAQVPSPRR